jgi:hypothetical protein
VQLGDQKAVVNFVNFEGDFVFGFLGVGATDVQIGARDIVLRFNFGE